MMESDDIIVKPFEEWMNPQVLKMFSDFYRTPVKELLTVQEKFLNHPYQINKAIKIVAVTGDKVIGYTSFAYWPYNKDGVFFNSYQVGNAMIHPDYRGKRIFPRLLRFIDENHEKLQIEILVAFPHISASYPSFMRSGYVNPFDLVWGVKIVNPFAFLTPRKKMLERFSPSASQIKKNLPCCFRLERTTDFDEWFFGSRSQKDYAFYNYSEGENTITFYLKFHRRGRWINELIIGDIRTNNADKAALQKAFHTFFRIVRKSMEVTIVSIAYNEHANNFKIPIIKNQFRKIKPIIHFVYRNYLKNADISDSANWELYRADLDTW